MQTNTTSVVTDCVPLVIPILVGQPKRRQRETKLSQEVGEKGLSHLCPPSVRPSAPPFPDHDPHRWPGLGEPPPARPRAGAEAGQLGGHGEHHHLRRGRRRHQHRPLRPRADGIRRPRLSLLQYRGKMSLLARRIVPASSPSPPLLPCSLFFFVPSRSHTGYIDFQGRFGPGQLNPKNKYLNQVRQVNLQVSAALTDNSL